VILLDVNMPDLDGFETAAFIRRRERSAHTPIIFISAISPTELYAIKGYSIGAVDYIFTPIVPEVLRAKVATLVELFLRIQEVREQAAQLSRLNAEMEQASQAKDAFLAGMSHELRTPLNAVLGLSEALQEETYGPINDQQRRPLRNIEESGRHLLALINDILDLAKIGAGKFELEIAPASIPAICQESMQIVTEIALKKNIAIDMRVDPAITIIQVDARRLKQILVNLLSNAVKFTPNGGAIGLEVLGDTARQMVDFTVWDTGIGIEASHLSHLFQPFVQLDNGLARKYEGTGLGLALVSEMTQLHDRSVEVSSAVGTGSRFTISLPWQRSNFTHTAPETNEPGQRANSAQPLVLLAEDNEANIELLTYYLGVQGYRVETARDGARAVALVHELRPAVVLMDIQMPGMDGIEAIRALRADPDGDVAAVPVIALTALAMIGDRERCLAAGANDYLSKPVNLKQLVTTIEALL
jgi:signal transduction histidine kinase